MGTIYMNTKCKLIIVHIYLNILPQHIFGAMVCLWSVEGKCQDSSPKEGVSHTHIHLD